MSSHSIAMQELAEAVSEGVLRAVAANAEYKQFLAKDGPGLIVRPYVTAGGMFYFGNAGRFASGANSLPGIEAP